MINKSELYTSEYKRLKAEFIKKQGGKCLNCQAETTNIMRRIPVGEIVDKINEKGIELKDVSLDIFFQKAFLICYKCNRENVNKFLDEVFAKHVFEEDDIIPLI